MSINRRGFLTGLIGLVAAPAIVRVESLMPVRGIALPQRLLTPSMITREAIRMFVNSNSFLANIERQWDDQFFPGGARIGGELRIRMP